jgi:putative endonuclease
VLTFSAVRDGFHYKFWVYILVSRTGTLYIGITGYFDSRISQHKMDSIEGFTSKYKIHRLVYYETYDYALTAVNREKQLKKDVLPCLRASVVKILPPPLFPKWAGVTQIEQNRCFCSNSLTSR